MISLILPVHNEYRNMKENFPKIYKAMSGMGSFEIIIAEDGSIDGTVELARKYARMKNVVLLSEKARAGKGKAIKSGVSAAKGSIIGFIDIDLSASPKYVGVAVQKVKEGNVFVIGNRYGRMSKSERGLWRLSESMLYNALLVALFNSKVRDHQCGIKFWSSGFIKKIINEVQDDSWFFDSELIIRAERKGIMPYQMPIAWKEGRTSQVSSSVALYLFKAALRFRLSG